MTSPLLCQHHCQQYNTVLHCPVWHRYHEMLLYGSRNSSLERDLLFSRHNGTVGRTSWYGQECRKYVWRVMFWYVVWFFVALVLWYLKFLSILPQETYKTRMPYFCFFTTRDYREWLCWNVKAWGGIKNILRNHSNHYHEWTSYHPNHVPKRAICLMHTYSNKS